MAEIIRRASEYLIQLYPEYDETISDWAPPIPKDLGPFLIDDTQWRRIAHENEGL